jgi:two-component sensor histidine kinase
MAALAICDGEVDRMHSLLSDSLAALRPVKPAWQDVDLAQLARQTVAARSGELERARLELELPEEPVLILGDGELLHRALSHLLRNALEALEGDGTIALRLRCDAISALLEVEDNGVGISQNAIPHLFQPQYSTKEQGNGLGLIAVQQTVRAHRGTVAIRTLEAGGTVATLRLPLKNPRFPALGHFCPCALCDGEGSTGRPHFPEFPKSRGSGAEAVGPAATPQETADGENGQICDAPDEEKDDHRPAHFQSLERFLA